MKRYRRQLAPELIEGEGIRDIVRETYRRVKGFLFGAREAPKAVMRLIERHGNENIQHIVLCRQPIVSAIKRFLDWASLGRLEQVRKRMSWDAIFHLYAFVVTEQGTKFTIEKNELVRVEFVPSQFRPSATDYFNVPVQGRRITVKEFIENGARLDGVNFWRYSALKYNCQRFVMTLLKGSGLLTQQAVHFLLQDPVEIAKAFPPGMKYAANAITNLAASLRIGILGGRIVLGQHPIPEVLSV